MSEVRVTTSCGTLLGSNCKTENGYEYMEFLQIPYAQPPVGQLRFRNPQPLYSWTGVRDATKFDEKNIAFQLDMKTKTKKGSEDCLYLNVYTPQLPTNTEKLLPVMIYIHGGGFIAGSGTVKSEAGPDFFIEKDVVIVAINYRLGVFGFLSLNIEEASGNMGLKDQVMALKWVQNNIYEFGGDKHNVTLFGISSGSASIEYLILSPLCKDLFQKAILQSGSALNPWAFDDNAVERSCRAAKELGFEGSFENTQEAYKYLMSQSTETLGDVTWKVVNFTDGKFTDFGFVPCVEKDFGNGEEFITDYPYNLLKKGKFNMIAMLRGFCEYEGNTMSYMRPHNIQEIKEKKNYTNFLSYNFNHDEAEEYNTKLVKAYLGYKYISQNEDQSAVEFLGDYDFSSGIWIGSKLLAKEDIPVYNYIFTYDGPSNLSKLYLPEMLSKDIQLRKGASHGDDAGYLLQHWLYEGHQFSATDILVKKRLIKMWTDFAKFGNPTPHTSDLLPIQWPRFTIDEQQYLKIDKELTMGLKYQPEKMQIFEELYEKFRK